MHWFWFLIQPGVEATNWRAEQAIRPAVVNRKVWGGNRTLHGADAQSILMSVLRTCHQLSRDAMAGEYHRGASVLRAPCFIALLLIADWNSFFPIGLKSNACIPVWNCAWPMAGVFSTLLQG